MVINRADLLGPNIGRQGRVHYVVNGRISVLIISASSVIGRVIPERLIGGALQVVKLHPLCELRILAEGRDRRVKVALDGCGIVPQSSLRD